jgi:hypothetical protein
MSFPITTVNERAWARQWICHVAPCTLAIVTGPLISIVYSLTRLEYAKDGSFSIAQAMRGILCLVMFTSLFLSRRLRLLEYTIIKPLVLLAVYAILTCRLGPYPYENFVFAIKLAFAALVFVSAFYLAQSNLLNEYWLIAGAWVILLFMAITQVIGLIRGNTVTAYASNYATAGVTDLPSITAILVISTLPIFLRYFPHCWWSPVGILIIFVSLFFTMLRTTLIAATVALLVISSWYLYLFRRKINLPKAVIAILVVVVFVVMGLRTQAGSDLLKRMSDLDPREGSGSGRYIFWRISLNYILDRDISAQVLGEGMGSVREIIYQNFGLAIKSHNDWLDFAFSFGIFGLLAALWSYLELVRFANYLRSVKDLKFQGVFSAIVILLLISLGMGGFYDPSFALTYAALGFWAGQVSDYRRTTNYVECTPSYRAIQF